MCKRDRSRAHDPTTLRLRASRSPGDAKEAEEEEREAEETVVAEVEEAEEESEEGGGGREEEEERATSPSPFVPSSSSSSSPSSPSSSWSLQRTLIAVTGYVLGFALPFAVVRSNRRKEKYMQ